MGIVEPWTRSLEEFARLRWRELQARRLART
jgi:hypothetical protein